MQKYQIVNRTATQLAAPFFKNRACSTSSFAIGNGTKQGGVLSPCLFNYYVRELILTILFTDVGCNVGGVCTNIFAYADDIVLLAPSWRALQYLGHLITNDECDDKDILREVRAMFTRVSMVWSCGVVLLCVLLTGCGLVI